MNKQSILKQWAINCFSFLIILLLIFVLILQSACSQPCTLTVEQAPEIRGFSLLMNVKEIQAKHRNFPTPTTDEFGFARIVIVNNVNDLKKGEIRPFGATIVDGLNHPELKGINRIYLEIIDSRIVQLKVIYSNDLKWSSVDEFVKKTAANLGLNETWKNINEDSKQLECNKLTINAGIKNDPYQFDNYEKQPFIELVSYNLYKEYELRKLNKNENVNRKEQERRDVFKP